MHFFVANASCTWVGKVSNTLNGFQVPSHPTPNQSVKRTCKSGLRPLSPAAYLQR